MLVTVVVLCYKLLPCGFLEFTVAMQFLTLWHVLLLWGVVGVLFGVERLRAVLTGYFAVKGAGAHCHFLGAPHVLRHRCHQRGPQPQRCFKMPSDGREDCKRRCARASRFRCLLVWALLQV
jgi:hypothetical protein